MSKFTTNQLIIAMLSLFIALFVELVFFQNGSVLLLVLAILFLYFGIKKENKSTIWGGIVCLFLACISLVTVRIFIVVLLVYALYRFAFKQQEQIDTAQTAFIEGITYPNKQLVDLQQSDEPYAWHDMLIERFVAQLTIDTTNTVLPHGKSFLSIRQTFGQIKLIVPYEVNIDLHMTVLYGELCMNKSVPKRLINETFHLEQEDATNTRTLTIFISGQMVDVEVVRA